MLDFKTFNKYLSFLQKAQVKSDKLEEALKKYNNEFLSLYGMTAAHNTEMLNLLRDSMELKPKDDEFLFDYVFNYTKVLFSEQENRKIYNRIKRIVNGYNKKDNRRNKK